VGKVECPRCSASYRCPSSGLDILSKRGIRTLSFTLPKMAIVVQTRPSSLLACVSLRQVSTSAVTPVVIGLLRGGSLFRSRGRRLFPTMLHRPKWGTHNFAAVQCEIWPKPGINQVTRERCIRSRLSGMIPSWAQPMTNRVSRSILYRRCRSMRSRTRFRSLA
jgi:hypothetical protein